MSLAMQDHTALPATQHKWTRLDLFPAKHSGTWVTYSRGM